MRRKLLIAAALLAGMAAGAFLLVDSIVFRLAADDLPAGRERGCYTEIETWMGLLHPSDGVRLTEFILAIALLVIAPSVICFRRIRKRRRSYVVGPFSG
ncbi:MAG TPA: hypothetical protein VOA80_13120 [Thermoanaerobaculia bacterium]|nr:hypothetical protein [Thermoanaerobaculia bacterium]